MKNYFIFLSLLSFTVMSSQSKDTEVWEPVPEKVDTYDNNLPPSDAICVCLKPERRNAPDLRRVTNEQIVDRRSLGVVSNGFTRTDFSSA